MCFIMLACRNPDNLTINTYLGNFSEHKRAQSYSIGTGERWSVSRSASLPGPGTYRHDSDRPLNETDEIGTMHKTGVRQPPRYSVPEDPRMTPEGVIKGLRQGPRHDLGPGQYNMIKMNVRSAEKSLPPLTIPKAKETAEAVRDRKKKTDVPAPDRYKVKRDFDDSGKEKTKLMERAVRRGTHCWAESQYSHIFVCMKPPKKDLEESPAQTKKPGQAAPDQTKKSAEAS